MAGDTVGSVAAELAELQAEAELPLEQLMAQYGYVYGAAALEAAAEASSGGQSSGSGRELLQRAAANAAPARPMEPDSETVTGDQDSEAVMSHPALPQVRVCFQVAVAEGWCSQASTLSITIVRNVLGL